MQHGDAMAADQVGDVRDVAERFRLRNNEPCAERQRDEDIQQRSIEAHRRRLQQPVFGGHAPLGDETIHVLGDRVMRDRHALGLTGGTGRVDDIGQLLGMQRRQPIRVAKRGIRQLRGGLFRGVEFLPTNNRPRSGVRDKVLDAVVRVGRVDR